MTDAPLWELVSVCKAFPGVKANDDISIRLNAGEIHGLLGENGCGKSTLIKILSGVYQPDSGTILFQGRPIHLAGPIDARSKGVATVFQEFSVAPTLTVAENIFLGRYPRRGPFVDWPRMRAEAARILASLDIAIEPNQLVGHLSVAEQQLVEIAKAISVDATLLILDEPTTALGETEIVALHRLIRRMKGRGVAILYISHRLDEVVNLVDASTILKDGRVVSTAKKGRIPIDEIISSMIGARITDFYPKTRNSTSRVALEVVGLTSAEGVAGATFTVHKGEVFGLGGVIGSGRTEIARAVFGADVATAGDIRIGGKKQEIRSPRQAIRAGLALVPENRKFDALYSNFRGGPNITAAALKKIVRRFFLSGVRENEVTIGYIRDLEIVPAAYDKFVNQLSGGNQQKIVIARWLFASSNILILDEPTQGIDIGAKIAVYRLINELTAKGCAIILISSDHNELIAMSDRIGIVRNGEVVDIMSAQDVTHAHLVQASSHGSGPSVRLNALNS